MRYRLISVPKQKWYPHLNILDYRQGQPSKSEMASSARYGYAHSLMWVLVLVLAVSIQSTEARKTCTRNPNRCSKGQVCLKTYWYFKRCHTLKRAGDTCTYRFDVCKGRNTRCKWKKECRRWSWRKRGYTRGWSRRWRRCPKICYKYVKLGAKCGKSFHICRKGKCRKYGRGAPRCIQLRRPGQTCRTAATKFVDQAKRAAGATRGAGEEASAGESVAGNRVATNFSTPVKHARNDTTSA